MGIAQYTERKFMLKFIYTEEGGRNIVMTHKDYPCFETMCEMFADFVSARGYDREDLFYQLSEDTFQNISLDDLCSEWREQAKQKIKEKVNKNLFFTETLKHASIGVRREALTFLDEIVEEVIDVVVFEDSYFLRKRK